MWEIVAVTLCLGMPMDADMSNCRVFNDSWGPYETREACDARLLEINETWPSAFAAAHMYLGLVVMFGDECTEVSPAGEEI